ncbi:hypothetical protein ACWZEH_30000 [Streptomyces sp. QTS137]
MNRCVLVGNDRPRIAAPGTLDREQAEALYRARGPPYGGVRRPGDALTVREMCCPECITGGDR